VKWETNNWYDIGRYIT